MAKTENKNLKKVLSLLGWGEELEQWLCFREYLSNMFHLDPQDGC